MVYFKQVALAATACMLVASSWAAPITFFAEDQSPGQVVTAIVSSKRAAFTANLLSSVQSYGFEDQSNISPAPFDVAFTGSGSSTITATVQGDGQVKNTANAGRFNTTPGGRNYWQAKAGGPSSSGTSGSFSIGFDTGISAFGFYGTDIGDFEGTLTLVLTSATGGSNLSLTVPNSSPARDGSLLFFGFYDLTGSYSKITFQTSGVTTTSDFFGFDDFIVADRNQISVSAATPEPASLALVGLALLAAGCISRRRRRA